MEIIDATHLFGDPAPFWVIGRPWGSMPKDITALERRCAAEAGIKAEDYGHGLAFDSAEDAGKVMALMAAALPDTLFYVVGDD